MTPRPCSVCGAQTAGAADGGVYARVGRRELVLCAQHTRMAQAGAAVVAERALAGLASAFGLGREYEQLSQVATRALAAANARSATEPAEPPAIVAVEQPKRRAPRKPAVDVIDVDYEVIR